MDSDFEIMHNPFLSALIIKTFVDSYFNKSKKGVNILIPSLLLPLVLHDKSLEQIYKRRGEAALMQIVSENKLAFLDFQERYDSLLPIYFSAINVCFSFDLVLFESESSMLIPSNSTRKYKQIKSEYLSNIFKASGKLGEWFSNYSLSDLFILFRIKV